MKYTANSFEALVKDSETAGDDKDCIIKCGTAIEQGLKCIAQNANAELGGGKKR